MNLKQNKKASKDFVKVNELLNDQEILSKFS